MKTKIALTLLAISLTFGVSTTYSQGVGDNAPDFTLNKLSGGSFTLSDQVGKVVFIFFFGYNCPTCEGNGPNTQTNIYSVYKNNPNFVAVGVDVWDGNTSGVNAFKATTGIQYPLLFDGSHLISEYSTTKDRIMVIDQNGKIQFKNSDPATNANTLAASNVISSLLESASSVFSPSANSKELILTSNVTNKSIKFSNPFDTESAAQIRIIDLSGKVVLSNEIHLMDQNEIDIANLSTGYYTIGISTSGDYRVAKFVKVQ